MTLQKNWEHNMKQFQKVIWKKISCKNLLITVTTVLFILQKQENISTNQNVGHFSNEEGNLNWSVLPWMMAYKFKLHHITNFSNNFFSLTNRTYGRHIWECLQFFHPIEHFSLLLKHYSAIFYLRTFTLTYL